MINLKGEGEKKKEKVRCCHGLFQEKGFTLEGIIRHKEQSFRKTGREKVQL